MRIGPGAVIAALLMTAARAQAPAYDPLRLDPGPRIQTVDLTVQDRARRREVPLRVYLPATADPAPVVLFSHGLGGSRENSPYLGRHWAGRGYAAVFLQHPGSDEAVWKDLPPSNRLAAVKAAANLENTIQRLKDVPLVIDQLTAWNRDGDSPAGAHPLKGRLDLTRLGMSGHSFGAVTTQWVAGERTTRGRLAATDPRIQAAVILSPSAPRPGDEGNAFAGVKIPWLLMTGTHDEAVIGGATVASRRAVYPALPPGGKYELVLNGAEHSAFGDRPLPGDREARNPNHHRAILALSTAFWDAYLRQDPRAKAWLDGEGPRGVLDAKDLWQRK